MKDVGSLEYVRSVMEKMHDQLMETVTNVEEVLGWNAGVKVLIMGLNM